MKRLTHGSSSTYQMLLLRDTGINITIRASDTDVVVLAVRAMVLLQTTVDFLWIAYGTGNKFR
jgi:hypothetical protein